MIKKEITFENKKLSELVDYLDIYVKHEIENDNNLKPEEKSIILNYPVVYIHTWKASGKLHVYVGETINLVRRTKEHVDNEKENSWQENWKNGQNHLSFYFSASCMNKSLALDIEDSLIAIFSFLKEKNNLCISNGRNNQQLGYSNKNKRDKLLGEIWSAINNKLHIDNDDSVIESVNTTGGKNFSDFASKELKCIEIKFEMNNKKDIEECIKAILCENISKNEVDESVLNAYPVVYMHIWRGEDNLAHVYTGETNNLLKRTSQHYNNEKIDYDFDLQFSYEEDENWHDDWKKSIEKGKAIMYVFSCGYMNISVTRDIENYLIRYTTVLHLSVNGRRNQQREYDNRAISHELFTQIVEYLNQKCEDNEGMLTKMFEDQKNKFCSLDTVKELSTFMASPLLCLSQEQNKAKKEIQDRIFTSLTKNENNHSLLIVNGEAGTGKTVLISSLLFDLYDSKYNEKKLNTKLFINHLELLNAYKVQAEARGIANNIDYSSAIIKAEEWINKVKDAYLSAILPYFSKEEQNKILENLSASSFSDTFKDIIANQAETNKKIECVKIDRRGKYFWKNIKLLINWAQDKQIDLPDTKIDIALIDEAHLIKTQGSNGGIKEAQLPIILDNSKVVVLMVDPKQFLDGGTSICNLSNKDINIEEAYRSFLKDSGIQEEINIQLIAEIKKQFRMNCCDETIKWIKSLYKEGEEIPPFPKRNNFQCETIDYGNGEKAVFVREKNGKDVVYEIGVFSNRYRLCEAIEKKKEEKENPSCLVASYCWPNEQDVIFEDISPNKFVVPYKWQSTGKGADDKSIAIWTMEKSLISRDKDNKPYIKVGAFHDIQGFDLKYAGVILGKSIRLGQRGENTNKIIFDVSKRKGISKDTPNWKQLIQNEIGVLLSRGSKGVYIYAEDDDYRNALIAALKSEN